MPTASQLVQAGYTGKKAWNKGKKSHSTCKICGKSISYSKWGAPVATCSKECLHNLRSQKAKKYSPPSRLGERVMSATHQSVSINGYVVHREGDGKYKIEYYIHRKMMEDFLGRKLSRDEVVHHIDGNKTNNILTNLMLMSNSEHSRLHMEERHERI